jgi:hypothetical protein
MPKATVRANAQTLPKTTKHPDAAIFELAERCTAAWQRREAACDLLEEADQRHRAMEPPKALVKTAQDDEMGLFVGNGVGEMYGREEIEVIRVIGRNLSRRNIACADGMEVFRASSRCREILTAWTEWTERQKAEEAVSGYDEASRNQGLAHDELDIIASQLAFTRASTVEGLVAKARALRFAFEIACVAKCIEKRISEFGVDDVSTSLSLAHDILNLKIEEAAR